MNSDSGAETKDYVVVLKTPPVEPKRRHELKRETRAVFGAVASSFARELSERIEHGDLAGVVSAIAASSGALPTVVVKATEAAAASLRRDSRIKAMSSS